MKIYCAITLNKEDKSFLREKLAGIEPVFADELSKEQRLPAFLEADICFGNVPPVWLEQSRRLRWLQLESAGFGEYQHLTHRQDLQITNLRGYFGIPVAESALAGILALYRGIDRLVQWQQEKKWVGLALRPSLQTLDGARVLVLGAGAIGGHLIRLLQPFRAEITVFGRDPSRSDLTEPAELDQLLPSMDIVACCLPETRQTINLMNEGRLRLLSPQALFVNVGRGSVVDERTLITLLQEGKIAGSVLDVTAIEPLPPDHPLWDCPNTILTQHTGGGFEKEIIGKVYLFLDNLARFRNGRELMNVVELGKGY